MNFELKKKYNKLNMENLRPKVWIWVIVTYKNKILLWKRKNSHWNNLFWFPGWHLEFWEEIIECAKRETLEEANINLENLKIVWVTNDIFKEENKHYITIFVLWEYKNWELKIMEPNKCEKWEWIQWDKMPENVFLPIKNLQKQWYNPFK